MNEDEAKPVSTCTFCGGELDTRFTKLRREINRSFHGTPIHMQITIIDHGFGVPLMCVYCFYEFIQEMGVSRPPETKWKDEEPLFQLIERQQEKGRSK